MKISDIINKKNEVLFSFEFFPPKDEISAVDFGINVGQLMKLKPSFVTVTYGAGGSDQHRTFAIVDYLQNAIGLTCSAHYTCVNAPLEKIHEDLEYLNDKGIKNVMLLRGDPPKGQETFIAPEGGFRYASELIEYVNKHFDFFISAACYAEKHPEAPSIEKDIENLKKKVDAGARLLISQLFFDNESFFRFIDKCRTSGINTPIIPGIIPITAYRQIERFTKMSGARIPDHLKEQLEKYKDNPEDLYKAGIEFSTNQCFQLLNNGVPGIHFYTLNKSRATVEIYEKLCK